MLSISHRTSGCGYDRVEILTELREASGFYFDVYCRGDTYIDDHHSAEDIAITLGQCINTALGSKAGVCRMGCAEGESEGVRVRVTLDLSNRPHFSCDLPLEEEYVGGDMALHTMLSGTGPEEARGANTDKRAPPSAVVCGQALSCEMFLHFFESLTAEARATTHVEYLAPQENGQEVQGQNLGGHSLHVAFATARAFGAALAECIRVDERRAGKVASSKGTLSI